MIKHLLILSLFLFSQKSFAVAELLVKAGTISISGYSSAETDLTTIYGGVAGNVTACVVDGTAPCNTCALSTGSADACNLTSVYSSMKLTISFKVTKTVTGVAKLFIDNTAGTCCDTVVTVPSATYTQDTSTVSIETTWGALCSSISGLGSSCTGASSLAASKIIKFGVDSDASGEVDDAERKSITLKFHYINFPESAAVQAYCPGPSVTGAGVCNVAFIPGDGKVYIDSALYSAGDSTSTSTGASIDWESIAIFPIPVNSGGEAAAYSGFETRQVDPIFKPIQTDGTIPDSQVTGSLSNFTEYCLVYGNRNKAQNIYKFVTTGIDTTTSCVTPSAVVGLLEDKHCFISTAAFGSEMAPEVDTFRKFRNKFLLNNAAGKFFVHTYNELSPPIAGVIQKNEMYRALTRTALYPLLLFAYLSLQFGFMAALLIVVVASVLLFMLVKKVKAKRAAVIMLVFLMSPILRAEVIPSEEIISHEGAKEGLVKITKEGTYIYDIKRELKSESSRITFGQANNPEISLSIEGTNSQGVPDGSFTEYIFEDFYDSASGFIIGYDYEKFPWIDKGKLGYQLGFGAMFANGHGRLVASPNNPSAESFTFLTLPVNAGGVYRFEWKDKQMLAPYVCGGGTYVLLLEKREDVAAPQIAGGFGFYGAGGLLFNVAAIDDEAGYALDSEYGISNLWLTLEFRVTEVNSESFGFSNQYVNAGLSFDF